MSVTSRELRERAAQVLSEQRSILSSSPDELTPEDRERYERLDREYLALTNRAASIDLNPTSPELAAIMAANGAGYEPAGGSRGTLTQMLDGFLRRGTPSSADLERRTAETRALALSTDTVPTGFANFLTMYERTATPLLDASIVSVVEHPLGRGSIRYPRLTADPSLGGTVTAEAASITVADPTLSSVLLTPFKYASITLFSNELRDDSPLDPEQFIAESAAREIGLDAGVHLTTGTDTTQPNGIVTAATNGGTATGTAAGTAFDTFFAPADLLDLWYGLPSPYRANPRSGFMASPTAVAKIAKFRDADGHFLSELDISGRLRFRGIPVYENPAMSSVSSASKSVLAGDFSRYVVQRAPVRVDVSADAYYSTDQAAVRVVERLDGDLLDVAGVRYLVSAAT